MRDADIKSFVSDISSLTGKTFVVDPRVKANVTVISRDDLSIEEAYEIFLSVLSVHGFTAVEQDNAVKIVPASMGRQSFTQVAKPSSPEDALVSTIVRPKQTSANALIPLIRPLINSQGHIAVYTPSNSLILTDRSANIKRIKQLVEELDKNPADVYEIVKLKNSSSSQIAKLIDKVFSENSGGMAPNDFNAYAIERSNSILLFGDNEIVERMKAVVIKLDIKEQGSSSLKVVYLKYADAKELVELLNKMAPNIDEKSSNKSKTSISAHEETNSLIISAEPDVMTSITGIISQIDIRRAQVLVEAIIVEISDKLSKDLGFQLLFSGEGSNTPIASQRFGNPTPDLSAIVGGLVPGGGATAVLSTLLSLDGFAAGVGKFKKGEDSFAAILNVLAKNSDSNVLSTPSILTMDNEQSSIIVGQEIPITTGESLGTNNSNPFRTINRQEIGIKLSVKPQINEGNSIKLDIQQEVSSLSGPITAGSAEIITNKRAIETVVMVEDNQTIVLGGLIDDDIQESVRKIPLLGDIPLIGKAFRQEQTTISKKNLVVFLKPTIIRNSEDMQALTNTKYEYLRAQEMLRDKKGKTSPDLDLLEKIIFDAEEEKNADAEEEA
jgi:general secretion pathway protein D